MEQHKTTSGLPSSKKALDEIRKSQRRRAQEAIQKQLDAENHAKLKHEEHFRKQQEKCKNPQSNN